MKLLILTILFNLIALYTVCAQTEKVAPEPILPNSTTVVPPNSTTITPPITSTATTTTTAPTTASTTSSSTTSDPTPTRSTTTTTAPPTTTTAAPPTTTTAAPPTPPKPEQGTWSVNTTGDNACILLKMAAMLEVNYINTSNITQETQISIPHNATSSGSCGDNKSNQESIKLTWWFVNPNLTNSLEFLFSKNNSNFELDAVNVVLILDAQHFPGAKDANKTITFTSKKVDFVTPEKMSYKCDKVQMSLNITNTTDITTANIKLTQFQFQAFGNITHQQFAKARDCEPYETPDIVPIAVGCALMALIIIVLIGYLIGRRRNQARGYLSM